MEPHGELVADYQALARLFAALGSELRLQMLARMLDGEYCVQELGEQLDRSQPNVSQHLAVLRERGLVVARRRAQKVCYSLADARLGDLLRTAAEMID